MVAGEGARPVLRCTSSASVGNKAAQWVCWNGVPGSLGMVSSRLAQAPGSMSHVEKVK